MIPLKPQLTEIQSQFGASTRSSFSLQSLRTFYIAVFGGVTSGVSKQSDFENKAQATVTGSLDVTKSGTTITLKGSITAGAVDTEVIAQYQSAVDSDGLQIAIPSEDESAWTTFHSITTNTNGEKSLSGTVPEGRYFFRLKVHNGFISHVNDHLHINSDDLTETHDTGGYAPTKWPTPEIISCSNPLGGNSMWAEWFYGENPDEFEAELQINTNTIQTGTLKFGTDDNWGKVENNKSGEWEQIEFPNPGDTFKIKVRAKASGGTAASNWSQWCSVTV